MATKNRQIQEVTEKVGTNHYEEEFLNNLGAPHGKDLLEDKKRSSLSLWAFCRGQMGIIRNVKEDTSILEGRQN